MPALSRPIVGVGLCSTRGGLRQHRALAGRASPAPTIESQKSDLFFRKPCLLLVEACIAGPPMLRPAFGTPAVRLSGRKHFPIAKKDPQTKPFAGLSSWCTISGSVQKTVQCTVFSDRSPRGECKPHRGAARARPVGDGAPPTSLSAAHNAKKDPQTKPFAGLSSWCTIGDSNPGPTD